MGAADGDGAARADPKASLVLCPNAVLCSQVVRAGRQLQTPHGTLVADIKDAAGLGTLDPDALPEVIVATPAHWLNLLTAGDLSPRDRDRVLDRLEHVVFDEADMLLTGGFARQAELILLLCKQADRRQIAAQAMDQLGLSEAEFFRLKRGQKKALWLKANEVDADGAPRTAEEERITRELEALLEDEGGVDGRVRELNLVRRQYLFAAATMPTHGKKSVGHRIRELFPRAAWLESSLLHFPGSSAKSVKQRWVEVADLAEAGEATVEALRPDARPEGRTMVFVSNARAADDLMAALEGRGIPTLGYHSQLPPEHRALNLEEFRAEGGGVLVCTDAAARGIDVPNVTHIVQSHFALSAVDYLHRVGRTARAGAAGKVTNIFTTQQGPLVGALRAALQADSPLESAFSRNRSFRKKYRKAGQGREEEFYAERIATARERRRGGGGGRGGREARR